MFGSFYEINYIICGIVITLYVIGFAGFLYTFMGAVVYKVDKKMILKTGIFLTVDLIVLFIIQQGFNNKVYSLEVETPFRTFLEKIPSIVIIAMGVLNLLLSITSLFNMKKWVDNNISFISLKEGIDALPMGICFYTLDGLALLVNRKIEELCYELTGHALYNGLEFWEEIVNNENANYVENKLILRHNDKCWCFEKEGIKENLSQIVCIDVTEEQKLNRKLEEENIKLNDINERLLDMKIKVANIARQEEQLAVKANIHSDMGYALLSTKALLTGVDSKTTTNDIIGNWQYVIKLLSYGDKVEKSNNTVKELYKAAKFLGLELYIEGNIPRSQELLKLFIACTRECMTNTVRHSKAKELRIIIEENKSNIQWKYINEPKEKVQDVVEGGGLLALRKMVTELDGEMSIEYNKKNDDKELFQLTVTLSNSFND